MRRDQTGTIGKSSEGTSPPMRYGTAMAHLESAEPIFERETQPRMLRRNKDPEVGYQGFYKFEKALQCWNDRFSFARPDLLKRYLNGRLRLHIHATLRSETDAASYDFRIDIAAAGDVFPSAQPKVFDKDISRGSQAHFRDGDSIYQHNQQSMLIDVVHAGEDCKGMILNGMPIRSIAWLNLGDQCSDFVAYAGYRGPIEPRPFVTVQVNRESALLEDGLNLVHRRRGDQDLTNQVVEAGAHQEQHFTCDDAKFERRRLLQYAMRVFARCRVELRFGEVRLVSPEGADLALQFRDVFFGTV